MACSTGDPSAVSPSPPCRPWKPLLQPSLRRNWQRPPAMALRWQCAPGLCVLPLKWALHPPRALGTLECSARGQKHRIQLPVCLQHELGPQPLGGAGLPGHPVDATALPVQASVRPWLRGCCACLPSWSLLLPHAPEVQAKPLPGSDSLLSADSRSRTEKAQAWWVALGAECCVGRRACHGQLCPGLPHFPSERDPCPPQALP